MCEVSFVQSFACAQLASLIMFCDLCYREKSNLGSAHLVSERAGMSFLHIVSQTVIIEGPLMYALFFEVSDGPTSDDGSQVVLCCMQRVGPLCCLGPVVDSIC